MGGKIRALSDEEGPDGGGLCQFQLLIGIERVGEMYWPSSRGGVRGSKHTLHTHCALQHRSTTALSLIPVLCEASWIELAVCS